MQLTPRLVAVHLRKASLVAQTGNLHHTCKLAAVDDFKETGNVNHRSALIFWSSGTLLSTAKPATRRPRRANAAVSHVLGATGTRPRVASTDPSHVIPATLPWAPRVGRYTPSFVQDKFRRR